MAILSSRLLLTLPAEICLQIYESVFTPLVVPDTHFLSRTTLNGLSYQLNLLLTCSQIYREARDLAYSQHTFVLTRDVTRHPFEPAPWPQPFDLITSILIPSWLPQGFPLPSAVDFKSPTESRALSPATPPFTRTYTYTYTFREIYSLILCLSKLHNAIILSCHSNTFAEQEEELHNACSVWVGVHVARHLKDTLHMPWYELCSFDNKSPHLTYTLGIWMPPPGGGKPKPKDVKEVEWILVKPGVHH